MYKVYHVYILTNNRNTVLYIGITYDIKRRMHEHKHGLIDGFSKKYNLHKLVHLEETNDVRLAIEREKELKKWKRQWKLDLIKVENPDLVDLSDLLG